MAVQYSQSYVHQLVIYFVCLLVSNTQVVYVQCIVWAFLLKKAKKVSRQ